MKQLKGQYFLQAVVLAVLTAALLFVMALQSMSISELLTPLALGIMIAMGIAIGLAHLRWMTRQTP